MAFPFLFAGSRDHSCSFFASKSPPFEFPFALFFVYTPPERTGLKAKSAFFRSPPAVVSDSSGRGGLGQIRIAPPFLKISSPEELIRVWP